MKLMTILFCLVLLPLTAIAEDLHPEVQAALDWQIQPTQCNPPIIKRSNIVTGTERRIKKAQKKYKKCIDNYIDGLLEDYSKMMGVAKHGLTQQQADIIMGHLKLIQSVLVRDESRQVALPAEQPPTNLEVPVTRH